jgi:mannose-6-phosphate isomerase
VLAVARALSLQAHHDTEQARAGYQRELRGGIASDARLYADDRAKPELVLAHTHFHALCGFRPLAEIRAGFERMGLGDVAPPAAQRRQWLPASSRAGSRPMQWLAYDDSTARSCRRTRRERKWPRCDPTRRATSGDPASRAAAAALDRLSPGEAIFLEAGELHCYLEGAARRDHVSSDNVLRAGLTASGVRRTSCCASVAS